MSQTFVGHSALRQAEFCGVGPDPVSIAIREAMQDQYAASVAMKLYLDHAESLLGVRVGCPLPPGP